VCYSCGVFDKDLVTRDEQRSILLPMPCARVHIFVIILIRKELYVPEVRMLRFFRGYYRHSRSDIAQEPVKLFLSGSNSFFFIKPVN